MGNNVSSSTSNLGDGTFKERTSEPIYSKWNTTPRRKPHHYKISSLEENSEENNNSRTFFLLYLLHKTWNVVRDKGKGVRSDDEDGGDFEIPASFLEDDLDLDLNFSDFDDDCGTSNSLNDSDCSSCSCSNCLASSCNSLETINNNKDDDMYYDCYSKKARDKKKLVYCFGDSMAPSAGRSPPGTQSGPPSQQAMSGDLSWMQNNLDLKENQRPPVYNAEDYVQSLKKYGRRPNGNLSKSIYDTSDDLPEEQQKAATLPGKSSESKHQLSNSTTEMNMEMSLRQFGSVTDVLTKLRSDLRAAFPSFVQEFVAGPLDGVSLLLEVLRAIQLSQAGTATGTITNSPMPRTTQTYQRRALLDELACLQCISLCCVRNPEACVRLGTSPIGLLPLAASATGQGIKSRMIALQLLTTACDRHGDGIQRSGHSAVSEALSTLRLRCGEPVRFRLLVGMFNSGGGTGELQATGLRFVNTFLESAENLQNRLYLEAELFQAGFEPHGMLRMISNTSPWYEKIQQEIRHWDENRVDIEKLQIKAREADKMRSQMLILERRVQIISEEKTVLTTMERRLQERCAELQREIFRLQGKDESKKSHESRPVALPRQVPPQNGSSRKNRFSEQEDEGISSSETGQSASPEPTRVLLNLGQNIEGDRKEEEDTNTTIEDVIEELENIVSDAERDLSSKENEIKVRSSDEHEIIPVNLLPQPPRKSRSLSHLISNSSDIDDSDFELMMKNKNSSSFFEGGEYEKEALVSEKHKITNHHDTSTNRAILNVIMDAREQENNRNYQSLEVPLQQFNGVFFMSDMKSSQKYPKPDLASLFENRKVSKSLDRRQPYGLESMVDIVMTSESPKNKHEIFLKHNSPPPNSNSNNVNNLSPFKIKTGHFNAGLYSGAHLLKENMRNYSKPNSKLTDLPSGLY